MPDVVNITIVTYNRVECTRRCLESLFANTDHPFVLNLIDNASTDGTRDYLASLAGDARYAGALNRVILLDRNMGISCAYNLGWSLSDTPYYIKVDNDFCFLRRDWLGRLVHYADLIDDAAMLGFGRSRSGLRHKADDRLSYAGHVGGCTFIKRAVHDRLGFWNEDYGLYGEEDADFGLRARLAGYCNLLVHDDGGDFVRQCDRIDANYAEYRQWKDAERRENLNLMFTLNDVLFKCGFRDLHVERMYLPVEIDGRVLFRINKEYVAGVEALKKKYLPFLPTLIESEELRKINVDLGFNFHF